MITLACPSYQPEFHLVEALIWSVFLLLPVGAFLLLPKLLPLGRELFWLRVKGLLAIGRVAAPAEAVRLRERAREAWLRELRLRHEGGRAADVVTDARLLRRARIVGWVSAGLVSLMGTAIVALCIVDGSGRQAIAFSLATVASAWLARVGGDAAGLRAQSLALGRGVIGRFGVGTLVGFAYGTLAGWTTAFLAVLVLVPSLSLMTLSAVSGRETMYALTFAGLGGAFVGGLVGVTTLALTAMLTRPPARPPAPAQLTSASDA